MRLSSAASDSDRSSSILSILDSADSSDSDNEELRASSLERTLLRSSMLFSKSAILCVSDKSVFELPPDSFDPQATRNKQNRIANILFTIFILDAGQM